MDVFDQLEQEIQTLRQQVRQLFGRPVPAPARPPTEAANSLWTPTVDAYEEDGVFVVIAELPGVKKDDLRVALDDGLLTIAGQRTEEQDSKDACYYTRERYTGPFARSFALPEGIDATQAAAEFTDGTLEVRVPLPAREKAQPITIPVKG